MRHLEDRHGWHHPSSAGECRGGLRCSGGGNCGQLSLHLCELVLVANVVTVVAVEEV